MLDDVVWLLLHDKDAILNFCISNGHVVLSVVSKWWQQVQLAEWLIVFKFYYLFYYYYYFFYIIMIILTDLNLQSVLRFGGAMINSMVFIETIRVTGAKEKILGSCVL